MMCCSSKFNSALSLNKECTDKNSFKSSTQKESGKSSEISACAMTDLLAEIVDSFLPVLNSILGLIVEKFFNTLKVSLESFISHPHHLKNTLYHVHTKTSSST